MSLLREIAQMMDNTGYPFDIVVEGILSEDDTGFIFKNGDIENPVGQLGLTASDDFVIRVGGRDDMVFVDATDVIMWIVQML